MSKFIYPLALLGALFMLVGCPDQADDDTGDDDTSADDDDATGDDDDATGDDDDTSISCEACIGDYVVENELDLDTVGM